MKDIVIDQYVHTWKMFYGIVSDFDESTWIHMGCSYIKPARVAYHVLMGVKYYIGDTTFAVFESGRDCLGNWETMEDEKLPTQKDILCAIQCFRKLTEEWIQRIDLMEENSTFPWAGSKKVGVVVFLLRHMEHHIGELNALLHLSSEGAVEDNWLKAFRKMDL